MFSFIETTTFTRLIQTYLSDEDYGLLQQALINNPEPGSVIRGSGGVRKIRWGAAGRGKRSGYRVIYYVLRMNGEFWMLTIYPKSIRNSIPGHVLRQIREEIENE